MGANNLPLVFLNCDWGNLLKVGVLWVGRGQGHLSVSSQAESGGTEWNVECGGSAEPHGGGGVRPPNFGAKGPLVGPGDL